MGTQLSPSTAAAALLLLGACNSEQPLTAPTFAKGSAGQQFAVAPSAVEFTVPPGGSEVVTVTAQYLTTVTSSSSNTGCATVSPSSVPTKKPKGSSSYVATFTISSAGVGSCTVSLTDKNGKAAVVQVTVRPPLPDRIVYTSRGNGSSDVYIMDLDGQNKTPLTTTTDQDEYGTLSPDGRQILFLWTRDGAGGVEFGHEVMGVDGSGQTPISVSGVIRRPAYSPNSRQLVFARDVNGVQHLYKADLSGANEVPLTLPGDPITSYFPFHWAGGIPGQIVFIRGGIWIMNADGSGQRSVFEIQEDWLDGPTSATLSPDGTRIVFHCQPSGHESDICTVNVDGTGITRLTDAVGNDTRPRWTRDGRIVFTSLRDGNEEVYIMNADGSLQTNLTNSLTSETTLAP